jgi:membrane protease YdiL (CAAX protease family)
MVRSRHCAACGYRQIIDDTDSVPMNYCPRCGHELVQANIEPDEMKITSPVSDLKLPQKKVFPTIGQSLLLVMGIWVASFILAIPLGFIGAITKIDLIHNFVLQTIVTLLSFFIVLLIGYEIAKAPFREIFPLKSFDIKILIPLVILICGSTILLSDVDNLVRTVLPAPEFILHIFEELFNQPLNAVILAMIIAPLTEEFLCRGLILHGFLKNYSVNKAVIMSAVMFMIMHMNPWQFAGAFLFGLIFAWIVVNTRSLWPTLIGHAVANSIPLLLTSTLDLQIPGFSENITGKVVMQPWWFDLIGLVLLAIGFFWLRSLFRAEPEVSESLPQTIS